MSRRPAALAALLALLGGTSGCAAARLAWSPGDLRAEIARRSPATEPADVIVPFELGDADRARAVEIAGGLRSIDAKVKALVAAMFDPEQLGLRYASRVTGDAATTLRAREGNCLALASVFVGLARAIGLEAYYIDASARVHETTHGDDGMTVSAGHVTAMVVTPRGNVGLDFSRIGPFAWYRTLDDVEAAAHFYNNRAYERIEGARARGAPVDWSAAALDFRRAADVKPAFAGAWSNLGMAHAALGREDDAVRAYEEAIRRGPRLVAPRNNLGVLLLRRGDVASARAVLEGAAALPSSGPHVLYNLALARLRAGDREGAIAALRAARTRGYARAQRLLDDLALARSGGPGAPQ
ncbi:MAG TPA: tetratricopeptide repeat protein [Anaeromyxobacter sp.]|nr:tetratricopeptide repeat protein [Anaeromyxobacter sp.]